MFKKIYIIDKYINTLGFPILGDNMTGYYVKLEGILDALKREIVGIPELEEEEGTLRDEAGIAVSPTETRAVLIEFHGGQEGYFIGPFTVDPLYEVGRAVPIIGYRCLEMQQENEKVIVPVELYLD